ncbi:hypothetical protein FRX31_032870, partial [Thalictrum thalictroides]
MREKLSHVLKIAAILAAEFAFVSGIQYWKTKAMKMEAKVAAEEHKEKAEEFERKLFEGRSNFHGLIMHICQTFSKPNRLRAMKDETGETLIIIRHNFISSSSVGSFSSIRRTIQKNKPALLLKLVIPIEESPSVKVLCPNAILFALSVMNLAMKPSSDNSDAIRC